MRVRMPVVTATGAAIAVLIIGCIHYDSSLVIAISSADLCATHRSRGKERSGTAAALDEREHFRQLPASRRCGVRSSRAPRHPEYVRHPRDRESAIFLPLKAKLIGAQDETQAIEIRIETGIGVAVVLGRPARRASSATLTTFDMNDGNRG